MQGLPGGACAVLGSGPGRVWAKALLSVDCFARRPGAFPHEGSISMQSSPTHSAANITETAHPQVWKLRWACYVLRAEARLPRGLQQRYRLGEVAYDPALQMRVYNHVFEVVDDQSGGKHEDKDKEVAALEAALERLRKGKGGSKQ